MLGCRTRLLALPMVLPLLCGGAIGCRSLSGPTPTAVRNPILVPNATPNAVWEPVVAVLHKYHFSIERENRLDGIIETEYRIGSGLTEPWNKDTVNLQQRLESTVQTVRRKVFVSLSPSAGGTLITFRAMKEIEDLPREIVGSPGAATFQETAPLQRDLDLIIGTEPPATWIPRGSDPALENALANDLRNELTP